MPAPLIKDPKISRDLTTGGLQICYRMDMTDRPSQLALVCTVFCSPLGEWSVISVKDYFTDEPFDPSRWSAHRSTILKGAWEIFVEACTTWQTPVKWIPRGRESTR